MLSAYQNAVKPGQTSASSADAKKALQDFNTMLRISMEEQLTSMIASYNSADDSSSSDSSSTTNPLDSTLSGLSSMSSVLNPSGSASSTSNNSSLLSSLLSGSTSGNSDTTASMLSSLLGSSSTSGANSLLNSLSGAENQMGVNALSGLTGSSNNSLTSLLSSMPGLSNAAYQQLAKQIQNSYSTGSQNLAGAMFPLDAQAAHINQFTASLQNGGSGVNADCGPTSLVMALHELGLRTTGETSTSTAGQAIDLARLSMANNPAKDGVTAQGAYSAAEHDTFTDFTDIKRGAQAAGAKTTTLNPTAADIMHSLQEGGKVIASGTFAGKSPLPWTGDSGFDNQTAPGNAAGHFVEVSAYDPFTKLFTINDPARSAPHQVSAATLDYFMAGNAGAMALRT